MLTLINIMKRKFNAYIVILMTFLLAISACKQPLSHYKITIERDSRSVLTGTYDTDNKIIYVTATDDVAAYQKGLTSYYAGLIAESMVPSAGYKSKSFSVIDTTGMDLSLKLPKKTIDSLTKMVDGLASKQMKR